MRKDKVYWVAMLMAMICLGVAALFFGKIVDQELQYKEGDDVYERIADIVTDDSDSSEENDIQETEGLNEECALDIGIDITEDQIVMLSTCAHNFHNARYVVHGRIRKT